MRWRNYHYLSGGCMAATWTTADYEQLGWHDCSVHGFRIARVNEEMGTAEVEFDIDYIVEWIRPSDQSFRFRVAPATLTFHDVFGLRMVVDFAAATAGMTPLSIDGIEREQFTRLSGQVGFRWKIPISWPTGEITFESTGFTQVLRREPVEHDGQGLTAEERGV